MCTGMSGAASRVFFTSVGAIPVQRGGGQAALDALDLQRQLLEEWVADQVHAYHKDRQTEKDRRLLDKSRYFDEP